MPRGLSDFICRPPVTPETALSDSWKTVTRSYQFPNADANADKSRVWFLKYKDSLKIGFVMWHLWKYAQFVYAQLKLNIAGLSSSGRGRSVWTREVRKRYRALKVLLLGHYWSRLAFCSSGSLDGDNIQVKLPQTVKACNSIVKNIILLPIYSGRVSRFYSIPYWGNQKKNTELVWKEFWETWT